MTLLSEDKILGLWDSHEKHWTDIGKVLVNPVVFARAIEAAVLEAQGKQKPVAFPALPPGIVRYKELGELYDMFQVQQYAMRYAMLYAAPVVQPDMVMVPREPTEEMIREVSYAVNHNWDSATIRQVHRAMIAAAEGKE